MEMSVVLVINVFLCVKVNVVVYTYWNKYVIVFISTELCGKLEGTGHG